MTARYLAVQALMRQERDGYSNLVLDAELKRCQPPLSARDAAFATRIFYTVLERQNLLDDILARFSRRPLAKLDPPVRAILRAGLAQASYMEVPLPAAVNESVKLTRAFGKSSASGMVNAMLRRAAACRVGPEEYPDSLRRLCIYYSLSEPVARLLLDQYGREALDLAAAFYDRHPTAVRVNTLRTNAAALTERLQAEGAEVVPGPWDNCLLVGFPGGVASSKAFAEGLFHVQGLASQYAALCVEAAPGMRVLDLCAAPGGKSLTMAQQMEDTGTLLCGEGVKSRVPLLEKAFTRCGVHCAQPFFGDAAVFDPEKGFFDRVLCDVPCSGLGVIGKKPDIRYKSLDAVEKIYDLQQKILENGARYLAQNGRLVYSTCTVNRLENEEQIRKFLDRNPGFAVRVPETLPQGAEAGNCGTLFLPHKTGTDGFFVAILERKR